MVAILKGKQGQNKRVRLLWGLLAGWLDGWSSLVRLPYVHPPPFRNMYTLGWLAGWLPGWLADWLQTNINKSILKPSMYVWREQACHEQTAGVDACSDPTSCTASALKCLVMLWQHTFERTFQATKYSKQPGQSQTRPDQGVINHW